GREEDIAFLDDTWANQRVNLVTIVAWAGVGKSTLINHWLRRMAAEFLMVWSRCRIQEGRLRDPSLQALLRELAAFNPGLCVITTRLPVADVAGHAGSPALRRDLEQLSSDTGATLLRAVGVKGSESELRR